MIRALCHAIHDPLQEPRRKTLLYFLLELLRSVLAAWSSENERAARASVCRHARESAVRMAVVIGEQLFEGGARAAARVNVQAEPHVQARRALRGHRSSRRSAAGAPADSKAGAGMEVEDQRDSIGAAAGASGAAAAAGAEPLLDASAAMRATSAKRAASAALQPGGASKEKRQRRRLARASAAAHDVRTNAGGALALALAVSTSSNASTAAGDFLFLVPVTLSDPAHHLNCSPSSLFNLI